LDILNPVIGETLLFPLDKHAWALQPVICRSPNAP